MSNRHSAKQSKKASCPFGKHCFSDSSVCGYIGYYAECSQRIDEKIHAEIKEGNYRGVDPYALFRAVRKGVRE